MTRRFPLAGRLNWRSVAGASLCLLALSASACSGGGGSAATGSTLSLVKPPDVAVQGCTYVIGSTIPAGEPQGVEPPFPPFTPTTSATTAVAHIKAHGGTGVVYGFTFPTGTHLYAGPDLSQPSVGVVPDARSLLASDPVLWTDKSGDKWLAFFVACGGDNLYWVSVKDVTHRSPTFGQTVSTELQTLAAAQPFYLTGKASLAPIKIDQQHHLVWVRPHIPFPVGRGELLTF